jgi:RNA polymerase sigma factor (sigma-70 family)
VLPACRRESVRDAPQRILRGFGPRCGEVVLEFIRVHISVYERDKRFLTEHNARVRTKQFERLYAEHAGRIYSLLAYRTGDRVLAEDLLADVFERVLTARRGFDPRRGTETSWLYAIALNRLRDHQRRVGYEQRAFAQVGEDDRVVEPAHDAFADRDELARALARLGDEERDVVSLRFGADLTAPQIARVIDEPLTTVEGRLYRALRKLRTELESPVALR